MSSRPVLSRPVPRDPADLDAADPDAGAGGDLPDQHAHQHADLHHRVTAWYRAHRRDLPWRADGVGAWAVLVSEIMLQQTPVARVEPVWRTWLQRWPTPAALASATPGDVLRAWDRLGYPRRALRLLECAQVLVERHGGAVPEEFADVLALPGVGPYTASAVVSFAHGGRAAVLDTNVRRVLGRLLAGEALPPPSPRRSEGVRAAAALPDDGPAVAAWNVAAMELGALVCTARAPRCTVCPVSDVCQWRAAGYPPDAFATRRRTPPWHGTDRQARGRLLAVLRAGEPGAWVPGAVLRATWHDDDQRARALRGLEADGLIEGSAAGHRLPTSTRAPSDHARRADRRRK